MMTALASCALNASQTVTFTDFDNQPLTVTGVYNKDPGWLDGGV